MNTGTEGDFTRTGHDGGPVGALPPGEAMVRGSSRARRVSAQVVILLLVVGASAASLWWMRREGMKVGVNFQEMKLEYSEPDAEKARTYARIMADLARIQTPLDVALCEFGKSPFMLETGQARVGEPVASPAKGLSAEELAAREAAERAEARRLEIRGLLENMRLQGIMGGRVPLARIDGQTLQVGDKVGEFFTVVAIEGRAVTLEADGEKYTLTMDEPKSAPKKAPVKVGTPSKRGGKP
jgi:hypothetical protein